MSKAAVSIFVFSIYMFVLGIVLLAFPNFLLGLFGIPETTEVWVRVVGMLVLILGVYYFQAARNELAAFFIASVLGRFSVLVFLTAFVLMEMSPPSLIGFGLIDVAAASWTLIALKSDGFFESE